MTKIDHWNKSKCIHKVHYYCGSVLSHLSHLQLCATLWTVAHQALLSMGFSRQEYWSGLSFPSPSLSHYIPVIYLSILPVCKLLEGINFLTYYCIPSIAQLVKNLPAMQETLVQFLGWEDALEKGKATHSSILAWRILYSP